jgi:methyl-accepting chemotaxis protein
MFVEIIAVYKLHFIWGLICFASFITGFIFNLRKSKSGLGSRQEDITNESEDIVHDLQNEVSNLNNRAKERKEESFQKVSEAFHSGGDIIETTTNGLQYVVELVKNGAGPLKEIYNAGGRAKGKAGESRSSMSELEESLHGLSEVEGALNEVNEFLHEIEKKSLAINEIASQANLLSFNASIEAARAGEHGRAFSVVATDINRLADVSGTAAKDISSIIIRSLERMEGIITNVDDKINSCNKHASEVVDSFNTIETEIVSISSISEELEKTSDRTVNTVIGVGKDSKTGMENLSRLLSDVIGVISENDIIEVTPKDIVDGNHDFKIIDVRSSDEFVDELGHLTDANHVWLQDKFKDKLNELDRNNKYLFVCRSGGRSARATRIAQALGFEKVYNLEGGMLNYREYESKFYKGNAA